MGRVVSYLIFDDAYALGEARGTLKGNVAAFWSLKRRGYAMNLYFCLGYCSSLECFRDPLIG